MFERATVFSAIFVFIGFGILSMKYLEHFEAKNQPSSTSANSSP